MKEITIYTDGSCLNNSNGGPGGWASIIVQGEDEIRLGEGYKSTTNNRMEIMAVFKPLLTIPKPCHVVIHTDSQYVIDSSTKWIKGWLKRNWKTFDERDVKNKDLWLLMHEVLKIHHIKFVKVKAHVGIHHNEIADEVAKSYARNPTLIDEGFLT